MDRRKFIKNVVAMGATVGAGGWLMGFRKVQGGTEDYLRPPGALPDDEFTSVCIRCGRCADACPNRCIAALNDVTAADFSIKIRPGEEGTPAIFPRKQACMLCSGIPGDELRCTAACPTGALQPVKKDNASLLAGVSMGKASVDKNLCYSYNGASCGVCGRSCPFPGKALKIGIFERPEIDPAYCIGCGLCERSCIYYPQAIRVTPSRQIKNAFKEQKHHPADDFDLQELFAPKEKEE